MSSYNFKKSAVASGFLLIVSIGYLIYNVSSNIKSNNNFIVIMGFLIIAAISTFSIIKDTRIISINKVVWYFCLIFMSISPLCQYISGCYIWRYYLSDIEIENAQLLIIFFYLVYFVIYNYIDRKAMNNKSIVSTYLCCERKYSFLSLNILFICAVLLFGVLLGLEGFQNLFIKGEENTVNIENSTIRFVVRKFLSAFPAMVCAIFILIKSKSIKPALFIVLVITVLSNFPTSTSRYWMGTILLGLIVVRFIKRVKSRKIDFIILIIVVFIFPFFYNFKFHTIDDVINNRIGYVGIVESFNTVDFDAFSLVARSMKYVNENGITFGKQLLNIVLFFVPRSIWPGKPIATNTLVASSQGQSYTNLSCPLPAEGFVNFSVIGTAIYSIVLALYSCYLDKLFWKESNDYQNNIINLIYPFLCIIIFYVSRGPLQPSFIQTLALLLPAFLITLLFGSKSIKSKQGE